MCGVSASEKGKSTAKIGNKKKVKEGRNGADLLLSWDLECE